MKDFLDSLYALVAAGSRDDATELIFEGIDRLLCNGSFGEVDDILAGADVSRLDSFALRSLLVITSPAKDKDTLPSRSGFYDRAFARFVSLRGEDAARKVLGRLR